MTAAYDLSLLTSNGGSFISILQTLNVYAEGYLGIALIVMAFIFMNITFIVSGQAKTGLIVSSFVCLLISLPLLAIGIMTTPQYYIILCLCLVLILLAVKSQ